MRSPALWLTSRELAARKRRVLLAALVVAATAAAATAVELVARAREESVAAQIDQIGPALTLVPRGVTAAALARNDLGDRALAPGVESAARAALGHDLRGLERRLVLQREVAGARVAVIGVEAQGSADVPSADAALLGSELARRLGDVSSVSLEGRTLRVAGVVPSTGSADDVAVLLRSSELQRLAGLEGPNELRLFLRAGVSPRSAEARLVGGGLGAAVIRTDRGDVAERETQESLARHRGAAYLVMAAVAGLCLLIAAHLDAAERHVELATLVAIGASRWTVLGTILSRSAIVAVAGAALGIAAGATIAAAQEPTVAAVIVGARAVGAATLAAASAIGVIAAAPTALLAASRDPVRALQDG